MLVLLIFRAQFRNVKICQMCVSASFIEVFFRAENSTVGLKQIRGQMHKIAYKQDKKSSITEAKPFIAMQTWSTKLNTIL